MTAFSVQGTEGVKHVMKSPEETESTSRVVCGKGASET